MLDRIKRLTIRALVSDTRLMAGLVLKGGNALNLVYDLDDRGSIDIDFSIEGDFAKHELASLNRKVYALLSFEFEKYDLVVFDFSFKEKPKQGKIKEWKGYQIEFKVIEESKYDPISEQKNRTNALSLDDRHNKKFKVDISSYEYVEKSTKRDLDGAVLRVYTPEMIVLEKLRALCQSMPDYRDIIPSAKVKGRSRDFYDIWNVTTTFQIDFTKAENKQLLNDIFKAKRVPVQFLDKIEESRETQRIDWVNVKDTVDGEINSFDFYFNFTKQIISHFKN
ncbi:nucleotidyl transferase AbiEii/AbiGii toxin family protein [Pareuzebyella sediminis]|uniref:nucleotidyl transferase AbiEii/AbiGii toxin family protein n=1 Tax=Pareuzebyella sediminis TaxID=2607998 RepID=UPI0011ED2471|nr:nucleotidyl transferase AbiEii/AbiGii toxin family protein [Pareuzebyella sediminis]